MMYLSPPTVIDIYPDMSSFRDLKKCVRQGFQNRPGILPCRTFVFLCVFQKRVITSLHVEKVSKFRRGGRGRGHLYATHYHAPPRDEVSSFSQTQIWSPYEVGRLLFYRRNMLIEV